MMGAHALLRTAAGRPARPAAGCRGFATHQAKPLFRPEVSNSARTPVLQGAGVPRAGNATMAMHFAETAPPCIHLSKAKGTCQNTSLAGPLAVVAVCSGIAAWRAHLSTIKP